MAEKLNNGKVAATVFFAAIMLCAGFVAFASGDWAMFRGDLARTGDAGDIPVLNPVQL